MKDLCHTDNIFDQYKEAGELDHQFLFNQSFLIKDEKDFLSSSPKSCSGLDYVIDHSSNSHQGKSLGFPVQETDCVIPDFSSQITVEKNFIEHPTPAECKREPELYEIDKFHKNQQTIFGIKKESVGSCLKMSPPISKREDTPKVHSSVDKIEEDNLQDRRTETTNFYHPIINNFIQNFTTELDNSIFRGPYDYSKVRPYQSISANKDMEIEVLDDYLVSFDASLLLQNSSFQLAKDPKRKLFQMMLKKEVNDMKGDIFSHFVEMSLRNGIGKNIDYMSWKKSIAKKLLVASHNVISKITEKNPQEAFGKKKKEFSFINRYLGLYEKFLVRETMRHALFSILIKKDKESKKIFLSRASTSYFLDKYSNLFLQELIDFKSKDIYKKKMTNSYSFWKKSRNRIVRETTNKARPNFERIFKSDQKNIRTKILVFDMGGFRSLRDDEFEEVLNFINNLVDFEGEPGIIERSCHKIYVEEYKPKLRKKNFSTKTKYQEIIRENKNLAEEKTNCFKIAKNYFQTMCHFSTKTGLTNDSSAPNSLYDYRCIRYSTNQSLKDHYKIEIEVMDHYLLSFDSSLNKTSFNGHLFSGISDELGNTDRRKFHRKIKNRINLHLRESIFIQFLKMSLSKDFRKKIKSYFSWKRSVSIQIRNLSLSIGTEFFGVNYGKKIENFIDRYTSFLTKTIIRETLRHALFSIPIEKKGNVERFFVSRITLSCFLNKYSDHFLNALVEYNKINPSFVRGARSPYVSWKKLKSKEIEKIIKASYPSFVDAVELDRPNILKDVLVFKEDGFKSMTDDQLQALTKVIYKQVESNGGSPAERAVRQFHRKNFTDGEEKMPEKRLRFYL